MNLLFSANYEHTRIFNYLLKCVNNLIMMLAFFLKRLLFDLGVNFSLDHVFTQCSNEHNLNGSNFEFIHFGNNYEFL